MKATEYTLNVMEAHINPYSSLWEYQVLNAEGDMLSHALLDNYTMAVEEGEKKLAYYQGIPTFESQICTTEKQGARLIAMGLRRATADMSRDGGCLFPFAPTYEKDAPAWTMGRLIDMMPVTIDWDGKKWRLEITHEWVRYASLGVEKSWLGECKNGTIYDNIIDRIEWLIQEGWFDKNLLNEED